MIEHWTPYFALGPIWTLTIDEIFGDGTRFAVKYTWSEKKSDGTSTHRPGCALVLTRAGAVAEYREYAG